MEEYIVKGGRRLRLGYTTGTCAAAAAKAAAWMLLTGREKTSVRIRTPGGPELELEVRDIIREADAVSCAIEKDSGDDPDVTKGSLIYAKVSRSSEPGIRIDGGVGVGRVTKRGLDQPVGAAAINSVPRKMITENIREVCRTLDEAGGLAVVISVPNGEELAKRTFNPKLGIVGGISILGTTGIVEPMSEQALVDTIRVELSQKRTESGLALLTPGNYGAQYIRSVLQLDASRAVHTSNFIGDSLDHCRELKFDRVLLVGHIGKLVKLAGGMFNTHSRYGDCRMEILASRAAAEGLPAEAVREMLDCATCDDAVRILEEYRLRGPVLAAVTDKIAEQIRRRTGEETETGLILFSNVYGELGRTDNAEKMLNEISGH